MRQASMGYQMKRELEPGFIGIHVAIGSAGFRV